MVAPEPAAGHAGVTPHDITADRLVLGRALLQRVVLAAADRKDLVRLWKLVAGGAPPDTPPEHFETAGIRGLRDVGSAGEMARIYDDAQDKTLTPAAFVAWRGERLEAPQSVHSTGQVAYQSWSVVLVMPMETVLDTAAAGDTGPLIARLERVLRGWMPRLWEGGAWRGISGVGRLTRITGDLPLHEWERQIMAVDLRFEAPLQGA